MTIVWICLAILVFLFAFSLCHMSAVADAHMEAAMRDFMEQKQSISHPDKEDDDAK